MAYCTGFQSWWNSTCPWVFQTSDCRFLECLLVLLIKYISYRNNRDLVCKIWLKLQYCPKEKNTLLEAYTISNTLWVNWPFFFFFRKAWEPANHFHFHIVLLFLINIVLLCLNVFSSAFPFSPLCMKPLGEESLMPNFCPSFFPSSCSVLHYGLYL